MKKILSVALSLIIGMFVFAACGEKDKKNNSSQNPITNTESSVSDKVKGFSGTIYKKWDEVKDDFASQEDMAKAEVGAITTISRNDLQNTLDEMEKDLKELENGVNSDNEEKAKEVYKDACKLELMSEKGDVDASKEFKKLGKSTKSLVKQYYGEADESYDTVKGAVKESFDKIKDFTDDVWNGFLDLFK